MLYNFAARKRVLVYYYYYYYYSLKLSGSFNEVTDLNDVHP